MSLPEGNGPSRGGRRASDPAPAAAVALLWEVLAHLGKEVEKFKGVSIEAEHLLMKGPNPLRENYLTQLTLQVKPPLSIWGVPKSCRQGGAGFLVDVRPYALSDDALRRWNELVASPAQ